MYIIGFMHMISIDHWHWQPTYLPTYLPTFQQESFSQAMPLASPAQTDFRGKSGLPDRAETDTRPSALTGKAAARAGESTRHPKHVLQDISNAPPQVTFDISTSVPGTDIAGEGRKKRGKAGQVAEKETGLQEKENAGQARDRDPYRSRAGGKRLTSKQP
jgi:hypothetical protein